MHNIQEIMNKTGQTPDKDAVPAENPRFRTQCKSGGCRLCICFDQIAEIPDLTGQHVVIEALLPVDVCDGIFDAPALFFQRFPLGFQDHLSLGDRSLTLQAERQVFLHFRNAHVAVFQTVQRVDPGDIPVIENAAAPMPAMPSGLPPARRGS